MKPKKVRKQGDNVAHKLGLARRILLTLICVVVVFAIAAFGFMRQRIGDSKNSKEGPALFTVERGDLTISVTESGYIKAVKTVEIKCKVEGRVTIVDIVPEGTVVTPEDVNNSKVLVELDSSKLKEQLPLREIDLATAEASFADANESYLIQVKQNESDVTAAELKVKFALMDFQKHLGADIAQEVIEKMVSDPNSNPDMTSLISDPNSLGGGASQQLDTLQDAILLARANLEKATDVLEGTNKLFDANYASELELKGAELDVSRYEVQERATVKDLKLYQLYDLPKETETFLSNYNESKLELVRTQARAHAQLAQAKAMLGSARSTLGMQKQRLEKLHEQIETCTIRATAPGQVVYWQTMAGYDTSLIIEQGGEAREGRIIIAICDVSEMKVEIKVHETWISKIQLGQEAKITVDAVPNKTFTGKVTKKAPLADKTGRWTSNVKVYTTDVTIEGTHDSFKSGMTGNVEVLIDELQDVLCVPIQSVVTEADETKVCYVTTNNRLEKREVETGLFNDDFVEIRTGLTEGEKVLLNPPKRTEPAKEQAEGKPEPAK
jgi:HlyD family secretion protein